LSNQASKQRIGKTKHEGNKKTGNNRHFSILSLIVNGFNASFKDME
jgi:hypothetical protein